MPELNWDAIIPAFLLLGGVLGFFCWLGRGTRKSVGFDECETCGYDLTGTPERCPECGTVNQAYVRYRFLNQLRQEFPATPVKPRRPRPDEEPVEVYATEHSALASLLAEHLEARGVACRKPRRSVIARTGRGAVIYGSEKLVVWAEDAADARAIIDRLLEDAPPEMRRRS